MAEEFNEDYYIHTTGEEVLWRHFFAEDVTKPETVEIGFFDQSENHLEKDSDVEDIDTEPLEASEDDDVSYERQELEFGADFDVYHDDGNMFAEISSNPTFDVEGNREDVLSYFVTIDFDSDQSDQDEGPHLLWTGPLDQRYDLHKMDEFTMEEGRLGIDGARDNDGDE